MATPSRVGISRWQEFAILDGVTNAVFQARRRLNDDDVYVLERASIDITVQTHSDASLDIERGAVMPVRLVASTMPRRLD